MLITPHCQKTELKNEMKPQTFSQVGFSLVELMVGLVIGLITTLVIMQMFSAFEAQKRTTSGAADAQTSGSIALFSMQRDVQLAGFGLPLYDKDNMPLACLVTSFDHDNNLATPNLIMVPFDITDGVTATDSDIVTVRYGTTASGGVAVLVVANPIGLIANVNNNMACFNGDVVYAVTGNTCAATLVKDISLDPVATPVRVNFTSITLDNLPANIVDTSQLSCLGVWNQYTYTVNADNQITRNGVPLVDGIVNMQAQYGVSADLTSNQVTQWVDAKGAIWGAAITPANRNRIKAVRIAVVARSGLLEKTVVSTACSSTTAANPTGTCAWDATSANPTVASAAPTVDLTNTADWARYRYKTYETIIPFRNVIWARSRL
jgi:type IV pilus assembly protein PilW